MPKFKAFSADTVKDFRIFEAGLFFHQLNPHACNERVFLHEKIVLNGRAEDEVLEMLKRFLTIEHNKDGSVRRAELLVPVTLKHLARAKKLLDRGLQEKKRLKKQEKKATEGKKKQPERKPSAQKLAEPTYLNSYRLTEVVERENIKHCRFVLCETYEYLETKGRDAGQMKTAVTRIPVEYLQMIIKAWLGSPLLEELGSSIIQQGAAQEVAQSIASHLGLHDEGSQKEVGLPSMAACNPEHFSRLVEMDRFGYDENLESRRKFRFSSGPLVKLNPIRFPSASAVRIYIRTIPNTKAKKNERRAYVGLPFDYRDGELWWQPIVEQFCSLPAWGSQTPDPEERLMMVPLQFPGSRRRLNHHKHGGDPIWSGQGRFIRALSDGQRQVCWSVLKEEDGAFTIQITTKRVVEKIRRGNLVGVHLGQRIVSGGCEILVCWSLRQPGYDQPIKQGLFQADFLPIGKDGQPGVWPGRKERRRRSSAAARQFVELVLEHEAELALEEVGGVKKRGQGALGNKLATRFNYSDLTRRIIDRATDCLVRTFPVNGFCLRPLQEIARTLTGDEVGRNHLAQADLIGQKGLEIRECHDRKRPPTV